MNTQKKSTNEAKILKGAKICKIIGMCTYVAACLACLTFIVLAIVLPLTCNFTEYSKSEIAIMFSGLALYTLFVIGVLWNVTLIFVTIERTKSPFGERVTHYIKKTGVFVALTALVPALVQGTLLQIIVPDSNVNSSIQVGGIIAGIVLYLLGYFFAYGAELKQKDDETL